MRALPPALLLLLAASTAVAQEPQEPGVSLADLQLKINLGLRFAQTVESRFPLDETIALGTNPFEARFRVNPELKLRRFRLNVEFDAVDGAAIGVPGPTIVADRVPVPKADAAQLRELYLEYRWNTGALRFGQQTSQFGLGVLSQSGAQDSQPGDFGHSRFGSLVWRGLAVARPFFSWGGAWRAVEPIAAADLVVRDSTATFSEGDRAFQGIIGLRFNVDADKLLSATAIYRRQRAENAPGGERATDVFVFDLAAKWAFKRITLGAELALITGTTTQGRTADFPLIQVQQLGALVKANFKLRRSTTLLVDFGYASGDANPYDGQITNFRFDRDTHAGLILFEQVIGYQSARSALRLSDRQLVGEPPEGVNLLPTGGAITSATWLFVRVNQKVTKWFDVYGGPLVAFSTGKLVDPFNSRVIGGGTILNSLAAKPGDYLGTELDLGMQAKFNLSEELKLETTLEGGALFPGNAFHQRSGGRMDPVGLIRLRLNFTL